MKSEITIGEKYDPAMKITDQSEADKYFDQCVEHTMSFGRDRTEAERIERINLGYYAGYYDTETRQRVEKLFRCAHLVFGTVEQNGVPTPGEAFEAGLKAGREAKESRKAPC